MSQDSQNNTVENNKEWELSELLQVIATELDISQDTQIIKSNNRRLCMMVDKISLDIQVNVRCDSDGKFKFRTVAPGQDSMTILKFDLKPFLDTQFQEINKHKNLKTAEYHFLETLPEIKKEHIQKLKVVGIHSVDDLEICTQTSYMLTEVSQKTGIEEWRIRLWRQLPYIKEITPKNGFPGCTINIHGGNFGEDKAKVKVLFKNQEISSNNIYTLTNTQITTKIPSEKILSDLNGQGCLFVRIDKNQTNTEIWTVDTVDIILKDITWLPSQPHLGDEVEFSIIISNQSNVIPNDLELKVDLELADSKDKPLIHTATIPYILLQQRNKIDNDFFLWKHKFNTPGTYQISCKVSCKNTDDLAITKNNLSSVKKFKVLRKKRPLNISKNNNYKLVNYEVEQKEGFIKFDDKEIYWSDYDSKLVYLYHVGPNNITWQFYESIEKKIDSKDPYVFLSINETIFVRNGDGTNDKNFYSIKLTSKGDDANPNFEFEVKKIIRNDK